MRNKKSIRFGIFGQFIISYLIIELAVLAALLPLYQMTLSTAQARQIDEEYASITAAASRISTELESASSLMVLLSRNYEINTIASYTGELTSVEQYKSAKQRKMLQMALLNWDFIEDFYLFFARNQVVITADRIWFSYETFYGDWFNIQDIELDAWSESLKREMKNPSKNIEGALSIYTMNNLTLRLEERDMLLFTVPFVEQPESGVGLFLLPVERITEHFAMGEDDRLQIYGSDRMPMLHGEENEGIPSPGIASLRLGKRDYTQFTVYDSPSGLTFVMKIPTDQIGSGVQKAYEQMFIYLVIAVLVGSLLSALFARRHYRPVKRIRTAVGAAYQDNQREYRDEYEYFVEAFLDMRKNNQEYSAAIESYDEIMHRRALDDLLFRRYKTQEELRRLSSHIPLPSPYRLAIAYVGAKPGELAPAEVEMSALNVEVIAAFQKIVSHPLLAHPLSDRQLLFIIPADISRQQLEQTMQQLRKELKAFEDTGDEEIFFGLSHAYPSPEELWKAFDEARGIIAFRHHAQDCIVYISDLESRAHMPVLSGESTLLLKNYIMQGEEDAACEFIQSAFGGHYLGSGDYRQLFYSIRGVLVELMEEVQTEEGMELPHYFAYISHEELTRGLLQSCHGLCEVFVQRKKKQGDALNQQLLQYLQENYHDPNVYGKSVAAQFGLKEKYLYGFFKERNGVSLSAHLERLRLGEAASLLTQSKQGVNEIAEQVGFNSANTFYKAFMRVHGVSPTEYRSMAQDRPGG